MSKEFKVGALVVTGLVILYFGFNFLKGQDLLSNEYKYHVIYDNVNGLTKSNPVKMNGLAVGRVDGVEIEQVDGKWKNKVIISVSNEVEVGDGTIAYLKSSGPLGGMEIELVLKSNTVVFEGGEEVKGAVEGGIAAIFQEKAVPMMENVSSLLASTDGLINSVDSVLVGKMVGDLAVTMHNLKVTTAGLDKKMNIISGNLLVLSQNLNALSGTLNTLATDEVKPLMGKFNGIADTLNQLDVKQTVAELNKTVAALNKTLQTVNSGEGTLGKLATDPALYDNLNDALKNVSIMTKNFNNHPKHFLAPLGKKVIKGSPTDKPEPIK